MTKICIIIGDIYQEKVKEFYGDGAKFGVKITYIYQDKPKGIANAISLCKEFIGNERFVVYLGDNILRKGLISYTKKFEPSNAGAMILLCEVDDPSRFGIAEFENNKIKRIVEKPKTTNSNLAVIGVYFLTPKIFDIIAKLKPSWRGELEITDSLQLLMEASFTIEYDIVTGWWKDTGTPEDILHANQLILDTIGIPSQFVLNEGAQVQGNNIVIGKNTSVSRDSFISGPVIIGDNCVIGPRSRIGPYVSVGNNSVLKNCDIENSIIMDSVKIDTKTHFTDSIIAAGCDIMSSNHELNKQQFLLGERSQIKF